MKWIIYDKTGKTAKCEVHKLEYSGEFMGACNITCNITSPVPVNFEVGDYLDYRGERFYVNYDPTVIKQSSRNTIGSAFKYDNVILNSVVDELVRCDFLDYVLADNHIHFTALPNFSFYASSVRDLADRLQANLDRIYNGAEKWTVNVHADFKGEVNQNVTASNISVWDALALANSVFKANFIIRGRTITIGTAGISANKIFQYGKGKGLRTIERNADSDQAVITRLRAYGSSKNLPLRYYSKIGREFFAKCVILSKPFNDAPFGIRISVDKYVDGLFTDPVLTGEILKFYRVTAKIGSYSITCEIQVSSLTQSVILFSTSSIETDGVLLKQVADFVNASMPTEIYITKGVNLNKASEANLKRPSYMPNNMAVNFLMLPGFPNETLDPYLDSKNIGQLGVREATIIFDGSHEGTEEIYPTLEGMTASQLRAAGVGISLDADDNGNLDEIADAEQTTEDGLLENIPKDKDVPNFTITLKDIGFNLNDYFTDETPVISMKNGMCGGREFEILRGKDAPKKVGNKWVIKCKRVEDSSLNKYFPYKDYNIKKGDKFVLTGIEMPDVYIHAASQRLLEAAKKYLAENDFVRYNYIPKIDDIFLARQHENAAANNELSIHDTLKEGDMILFSDTDLGIDGNIIIDTLIIKEGYSEYPNYEVTLREKKSVGTLDKIQQQIDSIVNGNGGGMNTEQIAALIKTIGGTRFIRKDIIDSTNNLLKLLGGAEVGESIDSFMHGKGMILGKDGRLQVDRIEVRQSMKVLELIINRLSGTEGDTSFSPTRKVIKIEQIDATTYKLFLEPLHDVDLIPFREGNILYSIVNDFLTGGTNYYTSYSRVLSVNPNEYSVNVSLYSNSEVPGGVNHAPVEGYNITRKGHVNLQTNKGDSNSWYISSTEGRLLFLQNVIKPILEDYNYALSIGKFPQIQAVKDIGIPEDAVGIMAETIVAQHIHQYDYNGDVVPSIVDRGQWSLAIAQSAKPYRNITAQTQRPNGTKYTLLEQHAAWRWGCKWGCLKDKTTQEPKWNAQDWVFLEGDNTYNLDFDSSEGWAFHRGKVETIITATVSHASEDITSDLAADVGTQFVWKRDSGNVPSDNSWRPSFVNNQKNVLHLTNSDMPSEWGFSVRKVRFICEVYVPDGIEPLAANEIGFNI